MSNNALHYRTGADLANAAIETFDCEDEWIWDTAQEIHDIMSQAEVGKQHG